MALTLPYPNMDFVPLDILTASELDQMVANIEYIASGSVFPIGTNNIADNAVTNAKIADGAMTTPKIADNAVTSSKIDFTTAPLSSSYKTSTVSIGYSITMYLYRIGNLVMAVINNPVSSTLPNDADNVTISNPIPNGYKPIWTVNFSFASTAVQSRSGGGTLLINPDGSIKLNTAYTGTVGSLRANGSCMWFTTDAFPA